MESELYLIPGVLENAQAVVRELRAEYDALRHKRPDGLLTLMHATFGLYANPRRVSRARRPQFTSSSSAEIGVRVHSELERASNGAQVPDPHLFTQQIADYIRDQGWSVIAAEVPIVVPELNMYTRADLLLFDMHLNRVLLVETKTGSDIGRRARLVSRTAHLGLPDAQVRDSHYARAHLQLAWMFAALSARAFKVEPIVLLANALHGVRVERLAGWARRNARHIFGAVAAHRRSQRIAAGSISSGDANK